MGSGEDWLPIAERLSQDYYCLLPDLPGHGATPLDTDPGYESWSAGLQEVLLTHQVEYPCLVGYSLGGRLALYFSLKYPELVTRLVLESASPGIGDPQARNQRALRDTALSEQIRRDGLGPFISAWYDLPLFDSLNLHPKLKSELHRQRAMQPPQQMAAVLHALSPGRQPDLWLNLPEIRIPTLLIAGRLDQKYTDIVGEMAVIIPNSQAAFFAECGHNVHRECATRYVEKLRQWLGAKIDN